MKAIFPLSLFLCWALNGVSQIKPPPTPQFKEFSPTTLDNPRRQYNNARSPQPTYPQQPKGMTADDIMRQQQAEMQRRMGVTDPKEVQKKSLEAVKEVLDELKMEQQATTQQYAKKQPDKKDNGNYAWAANEIIKMLEGEQPTSIKKAVWLAEVLHIGETYRYEIFDKQITDAAAFCKQYTHEQGLDWKKHDHRAKALIAYFSQTIQLKTGEVHKPFAYDFQDPLAKNSHYAMTVHKVLKTGKGQCHSLPLLFRVLAEEMQVKAYLVLSPAHSYIKLFLEDGRTPIFETTNNHLTQESWIQSSNIVPFSALRSGIYMDTLSAKETLVHCLAHLCNDYIHKFDYQEIIFNISRISINHAPNYPQMWAILSNTLTYKTMEDVKALGYPKMEELDKYPELKKQMTDLYRLYAEIDRMGYKDLDEKTYIQWLEENQKSIKQYQVQNF